MVAIVVVVLAENIVRSCDLVAGPLLLRAEGHDLAGDAPDAEDEGVKRMQRR